MKVGSQHRHVILSAPQSLICCTRQRVCIGHLAIVPSLHRQTSSIPKSRKHSTHDRHHLIFPPQCFANDKEFPAISQTNGVTSRNVNDTIDLDNTRPAILQSPPPLDPKDYPATDGKPPLTDRAKHLFKIGKSFLAFYKSGFFSVWSNYKQRKAILQKIAPHSLDEVAKYGGQVRAGSQIPTVSRSQYQFCMRTRHDILKLIPFSLVFAACGEFTPLVIIALGTVVVPYTCRIPKQEIKDLQKKIQREKSYIEDMLRHETSNQDTIVNAPANAGNTKAKTLASIPSWQQEWHEAYRYKLTMFRQPIPLIGNLYHKVLIRPSLIKHCNTILSDTILIRREGGFANLSSRSMFEWADKYSLHALNVYLRQQVFKENQDKHKNTDNQTPPTTIQQICNTPSFRTSMQSACDEESRYILERVDFTKLNPTCHWRTTFMTFDSQSPDSIRRRKGR